MRGRMTHRPIRPHGARSIGATTAAAIAALVVTAVVTTSAPVSAEIGPGAQTCLDVDSGAGGAAVVNLTPVRGSGTGFGLLISSDVKNDPPIASNANYGPGTIDPNVAIATIGTDGQVCYQNSPDTTVDLIADHLGTITATAYTPATPNGAPERIIDTRNGTGGTRIGPDGQLCFTVDGTPGDAAVVNLTPVRGSGTGFGLLISSDVKNDPPIASNANYGPGTIDPNVAIATIGTDGQVCYQNSPDTTVDLIADHLGTITATAYTPATPNGAPERIIDTRNGTGGTRIGPDGQLCFTVDGTPGDAAVVNLTPVRGSGTGFGLLISSDVKNDPPVASNANYGPGTIDPNVAIATIGTDGQVCYQNSPDTTVDLIADHLGTITATAYTPATPNGAPERIIDTRDPRSAHPECVDPTSSSFHQGTARTMAGLSRLAYVIDPGQQPGIGLFDAGVKINDPDDINDDEACWELVRSFTSPANLPPIKIPFGPTIDLPSEYDVELIVARNVVTQDLAVAFRGTEGDVRDIVTDILATKSPFVLDDGTVIEDAVHTGIAAAFLSIRDELLTTLSDNGRSGVSGARVFFTGHSLGGALATLGALDLHDELIAEGYGRNDIVTYSFGAPRSITVDLLPHQKTMQPRVFVVASATDPVPYLPPILVSSNHFTHAGDATLIQSRLGTGGVRFDTGPGDLHERCLETNTEIAAHDRHEYVRRLDAAEFQPPTVTLQINGSGNFQMRWSTTIEGQCDDVALLDGNRVVHRRSAVADGDDVNNTSEAKGLGYRAAYLDRFGRVLDFSPEYQPTRPEVWLTVSGNGILPDTIDMHWRVDDPGAKDLVVLFDRDPLVVGPDGYYRQFGVNRVEADPLGLNNSPLQSVIPVSARDEWWVAYIMEDEDGVKTILDSKQGFGR